MSTGGLQRRLGLPASVGVGLGAMVGAGLFVAWAPAAAHAGHLVLLSLLLVALVAWCNAQSSARLAAVMPTAGGTYVYGRERLGRAWGDLAGWCFVTGKLASCAAVALAVGSYVSPAQPRVGAAATVVLVTLVNLAGIRRTAAASIVVVAVVLPVTLVSAGAAWSAPAAPSSGHGDALGVLAGAGVLFFAFAGYARLATLGEEVRDPARTIPCAVTIAFVVALAAYLVVGASVQHALGAGLENSTRPLADAVRSARADALVPWVSAAAALAAAGALLSIMAGVSRTALAMARDGRLPAALARVSPRGPVVAEIVVGVVSLAAVMVGTVPGAITASSVAVLVYYAIANAAAWTLAPRRRVLPATGLTGCLVLVAALVLARA